MTGAGPPMGAIAVAGLSARLMAETAAADGFGVVALDLFGDVDTCTAASRWLCIGDAAALRIDGPRLLDALALLARQGTVTGWVAGSGFEGQPGLLAQGAALLPLVGTAPDAVARLRDPARFFAFLAANDIDHPAVQLVPAALQGAWLLKDAGGSGGWHIRTVAPGAAPLLQTGEYLQREVAGQPMSVTFVACASGVRLLGVNQQIVQPLGCRPHVYRGVLGPVPAARAVLRRLQHVVQVLTAGFALRGLCSLDFLLDAGRVLVLEVNARPPASMALYGHLQPMAAHVQACLQGPHWPDSPDSPDSPDWPDSPDRPEPAPVACVRGSETVFAPRALHVGPGLAQWLAAQPDVHDLPGSGQRAGAGEPLCSVSAVGATAADVLDRLHERRRSLLHSLETDS